ncbi:hypothetical protein ANN_24001 [Periplaneta americana]|uniref:Olfactory receptor n=1 Tax=Periplaneta americana TaxID=6978 RepID=A0ABQ8S1V3_PERAM|nr:hypothetical protein ANN_24001 [Periplaneta americana]
MIIVKMINVELPDSLKKLNILSLNVKIFKCFGLLVDYSQVTNRWKAAFFLFLQALTIFLHAQHLICTSIEMYILRNSPNDIGYGFIFAIAHAKNVLKLGVLIVYRTKYIRLFKSLDNNYLIQGKPPTDVELASLANYFQLTMRLGKYIWTSFVLTALSICFNTPPRPNLDKMSNSTSGDQMTIRRDSGMKEWFPVRGVESPYFELTTAYELLTMAAYFICVNLMNVTFLALIIYATAQFSLLADSLKNATTNVADIFKDRGGNSVSKKKLGEFNYHSASFGTLTLMIPGRMEYG